MTRWCDRAATGCPSLDRIPAHTFDAHRVIDLAAAGKQDAVKERFLRAYLEEGEPIGDCDALVRLAADAGLYDEVKAVSFVRRAAEVARTSRPQQSSASTASPSSWRPPTRLGRAAGFFRAHRGPPLRAGADGGADHHRAGRARHRTTVYRRYARRDLVRHRLPLVLRRQAPLRGRARRLRAPRRGPGHLAQLRARPRRARRARALGRRAPGREVRDERRGGPRAAGPDGGDGRRRRTRHARRSDPRRQHVRRPPVAPARRAARPADGDEGARDARLPHRGRAGLRP